MFCGDGIKRKYDRVGTRLYKSPGWAWIYHWFIIYLFICEMKLVRRIVIGTKWENISEKCLESTKKTNTSKTPLQWGRWIKAKKARIYKGLRQWKYQANIINPPGYFRGFMSVWCRLSYENNKHCPCWSPVLARSLIGWNYFTILTLIICAGFSWWSQ